MVVGLPGLVGHRVAVQWPGVCHSGNGHVPTRLRLFLGVAALVTRLTNDPVLVRNIVLSFINRLHTFGVLDQVRHEPAPAAKTS